MYLGLSVALLGVGFLTEGLIAALSQLAAYLLVFYVTVTKVRGNKAR